MVFLSASYEGHHFQGIARTQDRFRMSAAWHDFEIELHRHVPHGQSQVGEQQFDRRRIVNIVGLSVDLDLHRKRSWV